MQVLGLSLPVLAQRSISPKKSGSSRPRAPEVNNSIYMLITDIMIMADVQRHYAFDSLSQIWKIP